MLRRNKREKRVLTEHHKQKERTERGLTGLCWVAESTWIHIPRGDAVHSLQPEPPVPRQARKHTHHAGLAGPAQPLARAPRVHSRTASGHRLCGDSQVRHRSHSVPILGRAAEAKISETEKGAAKASLTQEFGVMGGGDGKSKRNGRLGLLSPVLGRWSHPHHVAHSDSGSSFRQGQGLSALCTSSPSLHCAPKNSPWK